MSKLFSLFICSLLSLLSFSFAAIAKDGNAVLHTMGTWDDEQKLKMDIAVWFPGRAQGRPLEIEGYVIPSVHSTRIIPKFYPIILLSHDTASSRFANNDLAISLASKGFIVVAPSHFGDTQNNSSSLYKAKLFFDRPRQMLQALEMVLSSPELAPYADESRIGIVGVGFGAVTALQLAGASPQFDTLKDWCSNITKTDPFCSPWAVSQLATFSTDMQQLIKQYGKSRLTPPITLLAPLLIPAPQLAPPPAEPVAPPKPSLFKRIKESFNQNNATVQPQEGTKPLQNKEVKMEPEAISVQKYFVRNNFVQTNLFGVNTKSLTTERFTHPATPVFSIKQVPQPKRKSVTATAQEKNTPIVYRRPASVRKIGAIALVTPAGGMLFNKDNLAKVNTPILVIEAKKDGLYDPQIHSAPLYNALPRKSKVVSIAKADHFSLFAPCSAEMEELLTESCGRLKGTFREAVVDQRDKALFTFFNMNLGSALPEPPPSELVANPVQPNLQLLEKEVEVKTPTPPQQPDKPQRRRQQR